ncbi:TonB-dependent receptor [Chitinophaga sp. GbtcB8]|uniref:TonB-dependent receptor domain-containing protein n=1 Tax=Chitinophaga sp. GbtcB8 TaxID=2824753 RepID=UPI001C30FBAE|nr:TonB-dependent receptor [Chitinophaga sp. GbtcB8]
MKNGILTLLTGILSCPLLAHAQKPASLHITGQVADSASRKPIGYATITLLKAAGLQPVLNTLTDEQGRFTMPNLSAGRYQLGISITGYTARILEPFTLDSLHPYYAQPPLYLPAALQQLKAVTVAGQKPLLEVKDDRLVYNVENDLNKDQLTAAEMLRRVPMVTVDPEGNVQLKGSSSFKILLNGKSTTMLARNPKEALRAFPAGVIKSIEVITQPSAKYDAEGAAGIINIITRHTINGYNGNLYANDNSRGFAGAGGSLNARIGQVGVAAYAGASYFRNKGRSEGLRENYLYGNQSTLIQNGNSIFDGTYYFGNLELSYDLDSTSSLSVYGNVNISYNSNNAPQQVKLYDERQKLEQTGSYTSYTNYKSQAYDLGVDYQKRFRQPDQTLSLSLNRNTGNNDQQSDNQQLNVPGGYTGFSNTNDEHNTETTLQLDYTQPLPHGQKLETGAKAILRTIESSYQQQGEMSITRDPMNPDRNNTFNYRQNVLAAYTTYAFKIKNRVNVLLGVRLEHTHINAHFIANDTSLRTDYLNFIPTANITFPLPHMQAVSLSYSRRLQRPWVWNLNPYVNDNDPNNITYGNPGLQPELNHSFGLNYNILFKGIRLLAGMDYTFTHKAMESYVAIDTASGITATTYANIGRRNATGFNLNVSLQPLPRLSLSGNLRTQYTSLQSRNGTGLHNTGWSANSFINLDYDLGKGFKTEAAFYLNSSQPVLQGRAPGYVTNSFTLRKSLFHQRAAVNLTLDQPFQKEIAWKNVIHDPSFYRSNTFYYPVRAIRIGFGWKFGQLKESVTRKKGVKNDDVKQQESSKP